MEENYITIKLIDDNNEIHMKVNENVFIDGECEEGLMIVIMEMYKTLKK